MNSEVKDTNQQYLQAALTWLLMRLERLALPAAESYVVAPSKPPERSWFGQKQTLPVSLPTSSANGKLISDAEIARAVLEMEGIAAVEPKPALIELGQRLGLSAFERNLLLLCMAVEMDPRVAPLCARAQDNPNCPYPTFALALALFDEPRWDVLSAERPLRYWRLIEITQPGAQALATSPLRADEWVVNYLLGITYLDDRLSPYLIPLDVAPDPLPTSQQAVVEEIHLALQLNPPGLPLPVVQLLGPDPSGKQLVSWQATRDLGRTLYRLPLELLPTQTADLETFTRLWLRSSLLLPIALFIDMGTEKAQGQATPLHRFLLHSDGICFLDTRDLQSVPGRASASFDIEKPTPSEQEAVWIEALPALSSVNIEQLVGQFDLNLPTIRQIARVSTSPDLQELPERVWEVSLTATRPRLDALAQRLEPKATWQELVLPEETLALLHRTANQVRQRHKVYGEWGFGERMNRGLGISALFAGPSGTGKTMAAEVIANDLKLNLHRIDLSGVVSKYIGETEKNLRQLFDAAEEGGTILFFDEADSLFGKRSEVKDSHDRYANIEINYLLQRMESFRGLAILATNFKDALDTAFMRRLRFVIDFRHPNATERMNMWQKVFPPNTPISGLDYTRLARLDLTGSGIHNVALNAAFAAAHSANSSVTMPLILAAARIELRKLDRPINEADFRWQLPAGVIS
jgi:hypothetical protein